MKIDYVTLTLGFLLLGIPALMIINPQQTLFLQIYIVSISTIPAGIMFGLSWVWGDERLNSSNYEQSSSKERSCKDLK